MTVITHQDIIDRTEADYPDLTGERVEVVRELPVVSPEEFVRLQAYCFIKSPVFERARYFWDVEHKALEVTLSDGEFLGVDFDRIPETDEEWAVVERELLEDLERIKLEELMENVGYVMSGRAGNALMCSLYRTAGDYDFSGSMPTIHYDRVTHVIYIRHWKQNHELVKLDAGVSPDKWALDGRRNWRALKKFMTDLRARNRVEAVEWLSEFYTVEEGDTEERLKVHLLSRLGPEGEIDFEDEEANLREGDEHEIANNVARFKEIAQTITEDEIEEAKLARWQETVRISEFWRQAGERIDNGESAGEVFGGIFGIGQQSST